MAAERRRLLAAVLCETDFVLQVRDGWAGTGVADV